MSEMVIIDLTPQPPDVVAGAAGIDALDVPPATLIAGEGAARAAADAALAVRVAAVESVPAALAVEEAARRAGDLDNASAIDALAASVQQLQQPVSINGGNF